MNALLLDIFHLNLGGEGEAVGGAVVGVEVTAVGELEEDLVVELHFIVEVDYARGERSDEVAVGAEYY